MTPLSRELAGLILPHDHFGSQWDDHGRTVNEYLEKTNFEFAGKVLAEVWNCMQIDGHPVHAIYVAPGDFELPDDPETKWHSDHVRESQYLLKVVRCKDLKCCSPPRSGLFRVLPERFLSPPVKMKQTPRDLSISEEGNVLSLSLRLALKIDVMAAGFLQVPHDYYCPSAKPHLSYRT
jgi:hypothetical protein